MSLEIQLRRLGRELRNYQLGVFWKIPEEMTQTPCDFIGHTTIGRAILIEAKEVNRTSLPINDSPGLLPHQWNALLEANLANALTFICWARQGTCATITMDMALRLSKDRLSIPWDKIGDRFKRPYLGAGNHLTLLEPWMSPAAALERLRS